MNKIAYYDQEIITGIAQRSGLAEAYVNSIVDKCRDKKYRFTYSRSA
ncbi:MAG: hypothetical protein AAGU12_14960 [Clostridiales bacterium]